MAGLRGVPSGGSLTHLFSGFQNFDFFVASDAKGSEAQQHFVFLACLHGLDCLDRSISTHYSRLGITKAQKAC